MGGVGREGTALQVEHCAGKAKGTAAVPGCWQICRAAFPFNIWLFWSCYTNSLLSQGMGWIISGGQQRGSAESWAAL